MSTVLWPPGTGTDRPQDEQACRRLMSWLFHDKAEAVATLLQHSAELEDSRCADALSDTAFEGFMAAAYGRAEVLRTLDLPREKPRHFTRYFRNRPLKRRWNSPLVWGLAAAALVALAILVRGAFDGFGVKEKESVVPGADTSYQTASESARMAKPRPQAASAEQAAHNPSITAQPVRIALPRFAARSAADEALGNRIAQMIMENLSASGLFTVVDIVPYGDTLSAIDEPTAFSQRHQIEVRAFLVGRVAQFPDSFEITIRLWDVPAGKQLIEQRYTTEPDKLSETAEHISDMVRQQLTGR